MTQPAVTPSTRDPRTYTPLEKRRIAEETQLLRAKQSILASFLVFGGGLVFGFILLFEAPPLNVCTWLGIVFALTAIRGYVCGKIRARLPFASDADLVAHERWFALSSAPLALAMGSGFWSVAAHGTDGAIITITLLCCVYAFGSAVNSSVHFAQFLTATTLNLGQGVLFLLLTDEPSLRVNAVSVGLTGLLLVNFGWSNSRTFARSVLIGAENIELAEQRARDNVLLQRAYDEAAEANLAKSRFLAAASHDLRQPLHAMGLFIGTLDLHVKNDEGRRLLTRIEDSADVLREQFDALLDLSRFDAGVVQPSITTFAIDDLLERATYGLREDAARKALQFSLTRCGALVESDAVQVERCVTNLVSNAVRYTEAGSISVVCVALPDRVRISISDTGIGIGTSDRDRIFDEFVQLHNPARHRDKGFGLGLANVRRIDKLLGLNLSFESTPWVGTVFTFELPRCLAPVIAPPSTPTSGVSDEIATEGMRPLVWAFDDDPNVAEALSAQLEAWGCRVFVGTSQSDVDAALRQFGRWPHLALLDDMLGDLESGLDIARVLDGSMVRDRIVILTGNVDLDRQRTIKEAGFTLLRKPVPTRVLREVVLSRTGSLPHADPDAGRD